MDDLRIRGTLVCKELKHNDKNSRIMQNLGVNETENAFNTPICPLKATQYLELGKNKFLLHNEHKSVYEYRGKSNTEMTETFSQIDTAFPSSLETEMNIDEQLCAHTSKNFDNQEFDLSYKLPSGSPKLDNHEAYQHHPNELKKEKGFNKICGLNEAKNTLKNVLIYPVLFPRFFPENVHWSQILLYGPPGTGKSLLAKAMAEEINASLYTVSSADLLSHWHGETEKLIRLLFEEARTADNPIILFFDEIDGLCRCRSSSETDLTRRIKAELLIQLQNDRENRGENSKMFLVGATNCPWDIDSAFLRRFHQKIYVPLPDKKARIEILKQVFGKMETDLKDSEWELIGKMTEGYSGSDLTNIVMSSCCERLAYMMNCQQWRFSGDFWIPADSNTSYSIRMNFQDLPSHQVQCQPIKLADVEAAISKTSKSVSPEDLQKFTEYSVKLSRKSQIH